MNTADAQFYWTHHPATAERIDTYRKSVYDPHRDWAVDAVTGLGLVSTAIEVGCHCGPLLRRLSEIGIRATGIDINAEAVRAAQADGHVAIVGVVPGVLAKLPRRSVDVVVASYCLSYIAPDDLPHTLAEMIRVAAIGVVIVEPMAGPGIQPRAIEDGVYAEWRHDYMDAIEDAHRVLGVGAPGVDMKRTRKGPHEAINGVVVARLTWHS